MISCRAPLELAESSGGVAVLSVDAVVAACAQTGLLPMVAMPRRMLGVMCLVCTLGPPRCGYQPLPRYPLPHGQRCRPVSTGGIDTDAHVWDRAAPVARSDGDEFVGILGRTVVAPDYMHVRAD